MTKISEISPISSAETFGFFFTILGFFLGILYSVLLFFKVEISGFNFGFEIFKSLKLEYFSIMLFPLFYLIIGFILGAVVSFIYNLAAKLSNGGVDLILVDEN